MLFKDLIPGSVYEKVTPNIQDARGCNAELGFRGAGGSSGWDINLFWLQYNNRFVPSPKQTMPAISYLPDQYRQLAFKGLEALVQADFFFSDQQFHTVYLHRRG